VRAPLMALPSQGFVNTHPSYLPYNRGKHYNFWALVEQCPFGVTLHFIDGGVDTGDIIAQQEIPYSWEDTGESLYRRAQIAMFELFRETYPHLRSGGITRHKQDLSVGTAHKANELENASRIELDRSYPARDLLNRLRARTFSGHPACWFEVGDEKFEVRIDIRKVR
ncbi:MAG: formyl transferase, partial [Deltaproteobacteria bacterium]|nr:formyl transferase [Deltaproteobacteria bacterium]